MERIVIALEKRSYSTTIAAGSFDEPVSFLSLKSGDQVMLVTNETLVPFYLDKTHGIFEQAGINVDSVILPDGEQHKNLTVLDTIFIALLQKPYDRGTTLAALGDGVIGGPTGFAVVSYQRDARFIQIPTALLSQVDSSVGGKTAVDHPLGKNMIGVFYQPAFVVMDLDCLKTFLVHELASGLVEVTKYGIIPDGEFFSWLEDNLSALLRLDSPAMAYCTRRYCELKVEAVVADEREMGLHALLNLGHTLDHVIEAEMGYGNWLHGEAVTAGTIVAIRTSGRLGRFTSADTQRIIMLLQRTGLPVNGPCEMSTEVYLPYMLRSKKVLAGKIRLILPRAIGRSEMRGGVSHEVVPNAITDCQQAQQ